MLDNFKISLAFTLAYEGGFVNHPADPGGATNKGITLATFRRYQPHATVTQLKAISNELVELIYRDGYWVEAKCDGLAAGVDGAVFDYAVNSGPAAARKSLMAVVGGTAADTVRKLCKKRLSIYQTFKHWKTFGKGWTRRVTAGEALWVKWALAASAAPTSVKLQLLRDADAAGKVSKQQKGGAAGAAGGTAATPELIADQTGAYILAGLLIAGALVAVWLLWRSHINAQREAAYAQEAMSL